MKSSRKKTKKTTHRSRTSLKKRSKKQSGKKARSVSAVKNPLKEITRSILKTSTPKFGSVRK